MVLVTLAALLHAPSAGADEVGELRRQLDEARHELSQLQERLDSAAVTLGDLEVRIAELDDEQEVLAVRLEELGLEIAEADERVSDRARMVYKHGQVDPLLVIFTSEDADDVLDKAAVVISLVRSDRALKDAAGASRDEAAAVGHRLEESRRDLDDALAQHQRVLAGLESDLERAEVLQRRLEREHADAEQRRLQEEERRQRQEEERRRAAAEERAERDRAEQERAEQERADRQAAERAAEEAARQEAEQRSAQNSTQESPPPTSSGSSSGSSESPSGSSDGGSGGYVCPMAKPHSFTDTWGAPRSGGRTHEGTDILASRGAHIYAVTAGRVDIRGYGTSAGYWLILRGADGTNYYYMHLDSFAVGSGPVSAGALIGYNGDTGNARGTPHLHFEQHPGGGGPINPYPFLRDICG